MRRPATRDEVHCLCHDDEIQKALHVQLEIQCAEQEEAVMSAGSDPGATWQLASATVRRAVEVIHPRLRRRRECWNDGKLNKQEDAQLEYRLQDPEVRERI